MHRLNRILKALLKIAFGLVGIIFVLTILFKIITKIITPNVFNQEINNIEVKIIDSSFEKITNNLIQKNHLGLWERYM